MKSLQDSSFSEIVDAVTTFVPVRLLQCIRFKGFARERSAVRIRECILTRRVFAGERRERKKE